MPELQMLLHTFAALADLGQEISSASNFPEMVSNALSLLQGSLAIRRGAILELDPETQSLKVAAARGLKEEEQTRLALDDDDVEDLLSLGLCAVSMDDERLSFKRFVSRRKAELELMRAELLVPLVVREELIGLIILGGKASGEEFSADDREVICAMGRHIGVGIHAHRLLEELERQARENRRLYEGLRAIYKDTVRAFAAAIDIKDKYTQGHSERVGKYSEIIAREMGWGDEEVEGIAIAGYLHDIGKLIVERDIINAPYRIDAKQSSELNRHPAAGFEILSPIRHPYADIPLMARHHHERIDGHGYPDGLTGDQIPMGAKIVTLADSFDAMTTDRPYKRRRTMEDVVADFRRNTGKQFEPEVVKALCRALLKEINGETKKRAIIKMLGKDYIEPASIMPLLETLIADLESGVLVSAGNA
ncbi:MAG TPA: HD domain-containing phosphohydrolase [Pyrinomonadaceae bacterium]|jgi:hypothetical protein